LGKQRKEQDHEHELPKTPGSSERTPPGASGDAPYRRRRGRDDRTDRGRRRHQREAQHERGGADHPNRHAGCHHAEDRGGGEEDIGREDDLDGEDDSNREGRDRCKDDIERGNDDLVGSRHVERTAGGHLRRVVVMTLNTSLGTSIFTALGTTAQVTVTDAKALASAVTLVERELEAIDLACSRFRGDSELTALNRSGGHELAASPLFLEALSVAVRAAHTTDGAVDPTLGRAISGLGWDLDFSVIVARADVPSIEIVPAGGWRSIRIDHARGTVRVARGMEIDLGATAKALAADRGARAVADATGTGVLVSLGGDIAIAGPVPEGGWPIRVTDDHRSAPTAPGQTIALSSGGLATSSTTVRRWRAGGAERHHILDPQTGLPAAEIWRTVSVAAPSCVDANVASTAAIVRGHDALRWLADAGLPSRLVAADGKVFHAANWPEDTP
jgi:FAD:protein FMN transferase